VLLLSLVLSPTLAASIVNIVRKELPHAAEEKHVAKLDEPVTQFQKVAVLEKDTLKSHADLNKTDAPAMSETSDVAVMSTSMKSESCTLAVSLTTAIVVFLYWRKGTFLVLKVMIYLIALATMKAAVKEVNLYNFKFPLFLTGTHFVICTMVAFALLLHNSISTGKEMAKPCLQDFGTRFGPIAVAFAVSVSMNNMALVYSTTSFVEIVGATGPIVTVLMTSVMGKPVDMRLLAPCFLVFVGCALTSTGEANFSWLGLLLSAGSNFPRAVKAVLQQLLLQQDATGTTYSPVEVLAWTCLPSSMVMLVWSFLQEGTMPYHQLYAEGFTSMLMVAVLLSCANACILNTACLFVVKDLGAVGAGIVAQIKSMLVVLGGVCFLQEQVSRSKFVGFLLVMVGVYIYNDLDSRLKAKREAEKLTLNTKIIKSSLGEKTAEETEKLNIS